MTDYATGGRISRTGKPEGTPFRREPEVDRTVRQRVSEQFRHPLPLVVPQNAQRQARACQCLRAGVDAVGYQFHFQSLHH